MIRHLIAAIVLASGAAASAQPPAARNGALDYWRASALVAKPSTPGAETALSKLSWEAIGANTDASKMPREFGQAQKEVSEDAVAQFVRAASAPTCDFQPHPEDGWKMLLPELAMVRNLSREVRVDARTKLMEGDAAGAAERLVAMYRAAGNVAREDVLISVLVGAAIAKSADDEAKVLAGSGKLAEPDRQRLFAAIHDLRTGDGMRFRAALEGERRVTSTWLLKEYKTPGSAARFVKDFGEASPEAGPQDKKLATEVSAMSPEAFSEAAKKLDGYYDEVLKAWDTPNAKEGLLALEGRLAKGDFGPIAQMLAPSLSRALSASERVQADLASAEDALRKKP